MWFHGFLSMICLPFCALLISGMLYFWGRKVENREQYSGQEAIRMVRAELLNDDSRNKLRRMLNSYASCLNDRYGDWCSYISDDGSEGNASLHDVRAWVEAFDDEGNPIDKLEREEGLDLIETGWLIDGPCRL